MKVVFRNAALKSINSLAKYIVEEIQMPETADRYIQKLYEFSIHIGKSPNAYTKCKNKTLSLLELKCAVFNKTWVFAFKVTDNRVVIYDIIYGPFLK